MFQVERDFPVPVAWYCARPCEQQVGKRMHQREGKYVEKRKQVSIGELTAVTIWPSFSRSFRERWICSSQLTTPVLLTRMMRPSWWMWRSSAGISVTLPLSGTTPHISLLRPGCLLCCILLWPPTSKASPTTPTARATRRPLWTQTWPLTTSHPMSRRIRATPFKRMMRSLYWCSFPPVSASSWSLLDLEGSLLWTQWNLAAVICFKMPRLTLKT